MSVALVTHHAKRMRHILLLSVPVWLHHNFPRYINGKILGGGDVIEHKMF
jgi:hypothetical protein